MASMHGNAVMVDRRTTPREEVFYRTRARRTNGHSFSVQIVNVSAAGFMARTDEELDPGCRLFLKLPVAGAVTAEVRWSLGGRIGCQLQEAIGLAPYLEMLAELVREAR